MRPPDGLRQFKQVIQYDAQNEPGAEEFLVQVNRLHASELLPLSDSRVLFLLRSIGSSTHLPDKEDFFFGHNALTNQIIFHGIFSKNDEVKEACSAFEADYLALTDVGKIKAIAKGIHDHRRGRPLLLISRHAGVALVVSDAYFRKFALGDESWDVKPCWTEIVVMKQGRILENQEILLHELFEEFPVFQLKFNDQKKEGAKFISVLKLLDFGEDEKHFIDAMNYQKYGYGGKLKRYKAEAHFAPFFRDGGRSIDLTISEKHSDAILAIYSSGNLPIQDEFQKNRFKANVFLYLSILFMKYSSGHYFKTTDNSDPGTPDFLRVYALGLFNKAYEIHANHCNCSPIPSAKVVNTRLALAGYVEICLGSLAEDLMKYSTHRVEDVYTSIIPPPWQE